jgi:hypothetical protein
MLTCVLAGLLLLGQQSTPVDVDEYVRDQSITGRIVPVLPLTEVLPKRDVEMLALYRQAYGEALHELSCVPAAYAGGLVAPRHNRVREALAERRTRVRALLAERVGLANIERVEDGIRREAAIMEPGVHGSCIRRDAERARKRYANLVSVLERRLASGRRNRM